MYINLIYQSRGMYINLNLCCFTDEELAGGQFLYRNQDSSIGNEDSSIENADFYTAGEEPAPAPVSEELQQLITMGFHEDQSAAMLIKCRNRVDIAATHLMDETEPDSSDFSDDDDPTPEG